ncbi:hypothetical protein [Vagococcus xieshaowenii]|uniref:Uncharacterized protein n=1 Tax=Vagococcus xieshaowenii TaxID=2562451 RepID=A0AAJ5EG76_9ENTE|nr:hypothetical protein [Vagococcus xieshaowenii]QCA28828.1 hypothetical protein E4Z98_05650 [Vagococcus xieshaowenii]TFZ43465.1 hypothetical protein E4031_00225 [Vagococcus xieshaowenii]
MPLIGRIDFNYETPNEKSVKESIHWLLNAMKRLEGPLGFKYEDKPMGEKNDIVFNFSGLEPRNVYYNVNTLLYTLTRPENMAKGETIEEVIKHINVLTSNNVTITLKYYVIDMKLQFLGQYYVETTLKQMPIKRFDSLGRRPEYSVAFHQMIQSSISIPTENTTYYQKTNWEANELPFEWSAIREQLPERYVSDMFIELVAESINNAVRIHHNQVKKENPEITAEQIMDQLIDQGQYGLGKFMMRETFNNRYLVQ